MLDITKCKLYRHKIVNKRHFFTAVAFNLDFNAPVMQIGSFSILCSSLRNQSD